MSGYAIALPLPWGGGVVMSEKTDADLITEVRAGDVQAFSELVLRHQRIVYNLAYRFMRDSSLAEDMAQEAFLKAFRLLDGFRGDSSFSTWLYRVTCSVCLTELDRRKRRGEVEWQPHHDRLQPSDSSVTQGDERELIRRCVLKLPKKYAEVLTLYYLQELPYEEVTRILRIPEGTLKTWMHRARAQLRTVVERELGKEQRHE